MRGDGVVLIRRASSSCCIVVAVSNKMRHVGKAILCFSLLRTLASIQILITRKAGKGGDEKFLSECSAPIPREAHV